MQFYVLPRKNETTREPLAVMILLIETGMPVRTSSARSGRYERVVQAANFFLWDDKIPSLAFLPNIVRVSVSFLCSNLRCVVQFRVICHLVCPLVSAPCFCRELHLGQNSHQQILAYLVAANVFLLQWPCSWPWLWVPARCHCIVRNYSVYVDDFLPCCYFGSYRKY